MGICMYHMVQIVRYKSVFDKWVKAFIPRSVWLMTISLRWRYPTKVDPSPSFITTVITLSTTSSTSGPDGSCRSPSLWRSTPRSDQRTSPAHCSTWPCSTWAARTRVYGPPRTTCCVHSPRPLTWRLRASCWRPLVCSALLCFECIVKMEKMLMLLETTYEFCSLTCIWEQYMFRK